MDNEEYRSLKNLVDEYQVIKPALFSKESIAAGIIVAAIFIVPIYILHFRNHTWVMSDYYVGYLAGAEIIASISIHIIYRVELWKLRKSFNAGDFSPPGRGIKIRYGALLGAMTGIVGVLIVIFDILNEF